MRTLLVAVSASAAAALRVPALFVTPPVAGPPRSRTLRLQLPFIPPPGDNDEDMDESDDPAFDGCDDWDAQLAEQKAWEESMASKMGGKNTATPAAKGDGDFVPVNEEAHFGLDDDDNETDVQRSIREQAEKEARLIIERATAASSPTEDSRIMTSLEAVLNTMMRLEGKVDKLTAQVQQLKGQQAAAAAAPTPSPPPPPASTGSSPPGPATAPAAPAAPEFSGWDGVEDESAWFDDDPDEDFADWRDVRRLKKMMELEAAGSSKDSKDPAKDPSDESDNTTDDDTKTKD